MYDFETKVEMLAKLRAYTDVLDDDNIRIKKKVKDALLKCPELLYAFHDKELENELFDENGFLRIDEYDEPNGEWDAYFGPTSHIRDYLCIPDVQTDVKSLLCFECSFTETPRYNNTFEKYALVTFTIMVYNSDNTDKETGIARHDLIASIIREKINWTHILGGSQCHLISNKAGITDNNYVTRTLVFQNLLPNSVVQTKDGSIGYINKKGLR